MGLWGLILLRLGVLSGERLAFHGLGRNRPALATTAVAYGGAAALLWVGALLAGHVRFVGQAFWPGAIYAVSFALYTAALAEGPVSVVSALANATVMVLFFVNPVWDMTSLFGMALFVIGGVLLVPWGQKFSRGVLWMLLSDVALAAGRLLDAHVKGVSSWPYAASLFSSVVLWLSIPITLYGLWGDVVHLGRERWGWGSAAALSNGFAYLTVFELLRRMPATLVEVVSSWAGVLATAAGVMLFHEGGGQRKIVAAGIMSLGTVVLLFSQGARIG